MASQKCPTGCFEALFHSQIQEAGNKTCHSKEYAQAQLSTTGYSSLSGY